MARSVFISYSHDDGEAVRRDAELLRAGGVRVFIDVRDIAYGERWRDVLRDSLLRCERVLVFWSAAARVSEWVEREWRFALELGKKIVPTLLDATPLPTELAEFQVVRRFDAPPRQGSNVKLAAAALVVAGGVGGAWWLHDVPAPAVQPAPGPLPSASAPAAPLPPAPAAQPTKPSPPPSVGSPPALPAQAPTPVPAPGPGTQPPGPPPVEALPDGRVAPGLVGSVIAFGLIAGWVALRKTRKPRHAEAQHTATGAAPDAEVQRFVEAVFSA